MPRPIAPARPARHTAALRRALLVQVKASCENRPGTYRMLGDDGRVLYVGQSRALRTRLLSYFRAKGRRNKAARILRHAFTITWDYAPDEFGALLHELRLIKQHRPHFNHAMVSDEWPRAYIALTGGPVPGLRVIRRTDDARAAGLWGPFRRVVDLAEAVRVLADVTGVRDCALDEPAAGARTLRFADMPAPRGLPRHRTPGCLRAEIGSCPGPCIGAGDSRAYEDAVRAARAFLEARDDTPLRIARERMTQASAALAFERAAVWRDRAERLAWLFDRVSRFHASMDRLTFRYDTTTPDGAGRVYFVRRGTVRAEAPSPVTPDEHARLDALAARIFHAPEPRDADVPLHDLDEFYIVASWFRRRPEELKRTMRPSRT